MLRISLGYPTTLSSPPWRGRMASFGLGATFAPAARRSGAFVCVPSMNDSLEVEVLYPA